MKFRSVSSPRIEAVDKGGRLGTDPKNRPARLIFRKEKGRRDGTEPCPDSIIVAPRTAAGLASDGGSRPRFGPAVAERGGPDRHIPDGAGPIAARAALGDRTADPASLPDPSGPGTAPGD